MEGMGHIMIDPGAHAYFGVLGPSTALVITAARPVVAEEQWVVPGMAGWSASIGVVGAG